MTTQDDAELARQERADDQNRWLARREREMARIHEKLVHVVGLIDRMTHEHDQIRRRTEAGKLVSALEDLVYNGPGPDPEDEARRKAEWEGRLPAGSGT